MSAFDDLIDIKGIKGESFSIAVAGADHEATLDAIRHANRVRKIKPLLFGDRERILRLCRLVGLWADPDCIFHCPDHQEACDQAVAAVASGRAHILMKGLVHTSEFARAILNKEAGLIEPGVLLSHLGLFEVPYMRKPLFITDAAVNIYPDAGKKKVIISNSLQVMRRLGLKTPKIALITPVETVSEKILSTVDAASITAEHRETGLFSDAVVEGPMAIDIALSEEAAKIKGMDSRVAGDADLLVCPSLDAANAVLKLFSFTPGTRSAGILVGLKAPIVLNSRSDPEITRYYSVLMAIRTAYC